MKSTLLLNASYEPLSIISAQRAVNLLVQNKVVSLDDSPHEFNSAYGAIAVPYVALLREQIKRKGYARPPKFSRRGVLVRDNFTCAFCGKYGDTIDHVVPRSLGGGSTYENCVAACSPCNRKKSNKTLKEIGWVLKVTPQVPSPYENLLRRISTNDEAYASWEQYISYYMPTRLQPQGA